MTKRILLVDDDELLCEVLASFLEMAGYAVVRASNGRVGLERLADQPAFDLVILDLLMPEMDGIRFLRVVNQDSPQPPPPVLVLSASATADVVDALDFPCVVGVIRKPIQPPVLLERIAAIFGARPAG